MSLNTRHPVQDIHFRLDGPVVAHLREAFSIDWQFASGEKLGKNWHPKLAPVGQVFARGISDGPDEDFERLRLTILGAMSAATARVYVVTPYFLPDSALITALNLAAMRAVEVHVVIPAKNNIKLVEWASSAMLWEVLERGCRVWLSPPPFDHTKLLLIDGIWTLLGSTNWDPRSLRLNFEFNVECYDADLARDLEDRVKTKIKRSQEITLQMVQSHGIPRRLRDGTARLLTPLL